MMAEVVGAEAAREAETLHAQLEAKGIGVSGLSYTRTEFTFLLCRISDVPKALDLLPARIGSSAVRVELHTRHNLLAFDHETRGMKAKLALARLLNRGDATPGYR